MITTTTVYNDVPTVCIEISEPGHKVYSVEIPATRMEGKISHKTVSANYLGAARIANVK